MFPCLVPQGMLRTWALCPCCGTCASKPKHSPRAWRCRLAEEAVSPTHSRTHSTACSSPSCSICTSHIPSSSLYATLAFRPLGCRASPSASPRKLPYRYANSPDLGADLLRAHLLRDLAQPYLHSSHGCHVPRKHRECSPPIHLEHLPRVAGT